MPNRTFTIFEGTPVTADEAITLIGSGSAGDRNALRRLVHPEGVLAPLSYFSNPTRTFNLDNIVLPAPISRTVRTLGTTGVVRFESALDDVTITEIWTGGEGRASMPTSMFRQLYEYLINPPAFDPVDPEFIQWEPRDRTTKIYNVEFFRLAVGGGQENNQLFDVKDIRGRGGLFDAKFPGTIASPTDFLDGTDENGLVDRTVIVQLKIVSEV